MQEYHKIKTLWKREEKKPSAPCLLIEGVYSDPVYEFLKDCVWVATEKVDGTNIRVHWDGHKVTFGGRTENAQIPFPLVEKLHTMFGGEDVAQLFEQTFPKKEGEDLSVCFYGEGYGGKIQSGGNYGEVDFVMFDVKVDKWWLERENVEGLAKKFGVKVVPIVAEKTLLELVEMVKQGIKSSWGDFIAEGIVARPKTEIRTRNGERVIIKLKTRDFVK